MTALFAPAYAIIKRLNLALNFALIAVLFGLAQVFSGWWGPALAVAVNLLAIYFAASLYSWIRAAMARQRETVDRIASGDLTAGLSGVSLSGLQVSEAARLSQSVERMTRGLVEIVNQVRTSADAIVRSANESAAGNVDLSQRTEAQASALEETSSGMEELSATVRQNSENCSRARSLAGNARTVAEQAAAKMRDATATMRAISDSSGKVADIIGVIEGIAFQTNILALNAAVEAAHAGAQGRGFAVVASEVRSLAARSAAAALEIKGLVGASIDNVATGMRQVGEADRTIGEVVASVEGVHGLIGEVAAASAEQSAGVEEINRSILQLDEMTQRNAALVEQATAAALAFEDEAARLVEVVRAFKVDRMEAREQAVELVRKAIAHLRAVGVARACADFEQEQGEFKFGEFYVSAIDMNGVHLAHGGNPALRGNSVLTVKDADGREFMRDVFNTAKAKGLGWSDYRWKHHITGKIEWKSLYYELGGNVIVTCGIYKGAEQGDSDFPSAIPHLALPTR